MSKSNSQQLKFLKTLLHFGFFASGIATVLIGQVLPVLSQKFSLNDEQTGNFFPAQFAGSLIGTFLTSWFGKKNKFLLATIIGSFLMGLGILMLNFGSYEMCLAAFFVNGIGIGLTLPSVNMLVLELNPERATSALSILNFLWGFGAILSQPFVDLLRSGSNISIPTAALSVAMLVIAALLIILPKGLEQKPDSSEETSSEFSKPIWTNPIAWAIAAFNFVHVGFESGMGGWLKTYTERIDGSAATHLFPPIFLFFVFFVVGRGVAPVFLRFFSENGMLLFSLLLTLIGMSIALFATDVLTLGIGASVSGFGTSSIFPTNLSRFSKTFGASASRRAMPFFICGTLGGAFTTWLIGYTSTYFQDLRVAMFILLGSIVFLIVLQIGLGFRKLLK